MEQIRVPLIRVYFVGGESGAVWGLDLGTAETMRQFAAVEWEKISGRTRAGLRMNAGDELHPRVWLEFRHAIARFEEDKAILFHDTNWREPKIEA